MHLKTLKHNLLVGIRTTFATIAMLQFSLVAPITGAAQNTEPQSPIKHVIVIVGENRSFDHLFATFVPREGETVDNLLSKGIGQLTAVGGAVPAYTRRVRRRMRGMLRR